MNEVSERSKEVVADKISQATGLPVNMFKFGGMF